LLLLQSRQIVVGFSPQDDNVVLHLLRPLRFCASGLKVLLGAATQLLRRDASDL